MVIQSYKKAFAHFLSIVFHPLLLTFQLFAVVIYTMPEKLSPWNVNSVEIILLVIFICTFVIPALFVMLINIFLNMDISFQNLLMNDSKERILPFFLVGLIYTFIAYLLNEKLHANYSMVLIMSATSVCILLSAAINIWWKISAHGVGLGAVTGFLLALNRNNADTEILYVILIFIIISGFILSARLYLNAHTPLQVLCGWICGFVIALGCFIKSL